jgi:hypothetical protein
MGANAQTSVPAFTTGQVLTAQQQTEINTGVPVFATTTTRDAAFGGTGEKVLAEGQLAYIEASDVVQYYNGSSWATLAPATSGALVYLTGAAFTSVASVSLPNNTFTSTYRNYKIVLHVTSSASDMVGTMRLRAGGTDDSAGSYLFGGIQVSNGGASVSFSGNNQTSWGIMDGQSALGGSMSMDLIAPQLSVRTFMNGTISDSDATYNLKGGSGGFVFNATTSFDACTFLFSANSTGIYRVYGYADS